MKKLFSILLLCLCCICLVILSGCSCKGQGDTPNSGSAMTWQENYDLGIRLLAEGNYEEAILAFQAAIQIDPKRAENYISLTDAYIGAGDYVSAWDTLYSGIDQAGYIPEFERLEHYLSFLDSEEAGVYIRTVDFERSSYLARSETLFTVTIDYRCPSGTEAYLVLGDNSNDEPGSFGFMGEPTTVTGEGTATLSISSIPTLPSGHPFGLAAHISPFDGSGDSLDWIYLDSEGNITLTPEVDYNDVEDQWEQESAHPLAALFAADPDAGFGIDELTLFGTPIKGLSLEEAADIALQNGFPGRTATEGDYTSFFAFYHDDTANPFLGISRQYPADDPAVENISYLHSLTLDDDGNPLRKEDAIPVWVGIRSIYTYDTLEQVLNALGYSNSHEIAIQIHDILQLPEAEARIQLENLWQWGWCCTTNGISHSLDTGLVNGWDFTWYGSDPETEKTYSVRFTFDVTADCLTDVYISVY